MPKPLLVATALVAVAGSTALAGPTERKLAPSSTTASSWKENDWKDFHETGHPGYAADGDAKTAWIENGATSGAGEWIRYTFVALDKTTKVRLKLETGDQGDAKKLAASPRVKTVTVKLLPSGKTADAKLDDKLGFQEVTVEQPAGPLTGVEVAIKDVYEGNDAKAKTAKDLAVDELQVWATSEMPAAPAFEAAHEAMNKQWRAGRAAAAKFATKTGTPVYAGYVIRVSPLTPPKTLGLESMIALSEADPVIGKDLKYALVQAKQAVAAFDKLQAVTLAPKSTEVAPSADGVQVPTVQTVADADYDPTTFRVPINGVRGLMFSTDMKFTDSKDKTTPATFMTETGPCKAAERAWVVRGDAPEMAAGAQVVRVLVVARCATVQTREGKAKEHRTREIYVYNPDNAASIVIGENHVEGYRWGLDHGHGLIRGGRSLLPTQSKFLDANLRDDQ